MSTIIVEGVLFAALIAVAAALLRYLLWHFTPLGVWRRQTANRRRIEREAVRFTCAVHGPRREHELVRLPDGDSICPDCYREALR